MESGTSGWSSLTLAVGAVLVAAAGETSGADWLKAREIHVDRVNVAPELVEATRESQIERGRPRPVLDAAGWVVGIPAKIILWDRRVNNHDVSPDTENAIRRYLDDNDLDHVKVAINKYDPVDDWHRLRANKTVGWGYRSTLGALSVAGEAILPGRLIGGDHYNPFTGTIYVYSDVPAIALQKGGHAKDLARRSHPGTYALIAALPVTSLWPEAIATADAIAYAEQHGDPDLEREGYRVLFPAYGTCVGGSLGRFAPPVALPIYAGAVVAGHAVGRVEARMVPDAGPDAFPAEDDITPLPDAQVSHEEPAESTALGDAGDGRLAWWPFGPRRATSTWGR